MNYVCLVPGHISAELHPPRDLAGLAGGAEPELDRGARVRRGVPAGCSQLFPRVSRCVRLGHCVCVRLCVCVFASLRCLSSVASLMRLHLSSAWL